MHGPPAHGWLPCADDGAPSLPAAPPTLPPHVPPPPPPALSYNAVVRQRSQEAPDNHVADGHTGPGLLPPLPECPAGPSIPTHQQLAFASERHSASLSAARAAFQTAPEATAAEQEATAGAVHVCAADAMLGGGEVGSMPPSAEELTAQLLRAGATFLFEKVRAVAAP